MRIGEVLEALSSLPRQSPDRLKDKSEFHNGSELDALVRLAEAFEKQRGYRDALECYWKALEMGRKAEMMTDWIELRVQRVSKRLREKK